MRAAFVSVLVATAGCIFDSTGGSGGGELGTGESTGAAGSEGSEGSSAATDESSTSGGPTTGPVRRRLSVGAEAVGAAPVLIRLTPSRVEYDRTLEAGADLAFYDAQMQTVLPHEIEWWSPNDESTVWVRLPDPAPSHIWMVYGTEEPAPSVDPEFVWDTDFGAVWHFSGPIAGGPVRDSTTHGHDGEWVDAPADATQPGIAGQSLTNDGGAGFVEILDGGPLVETALTLEAWVRLDGIDPSAARFPIWKPDAYFVRAMEQGNAQPRFGVRLEGDGLLEAGPSNTLGADDWCYVAATFDAQNGLLRFFVDAVEVDLEDASAMLSPDSVIAAGSQPLQLARNLIGGLDEVRISGTARPQSWIEGQYASMTDELIDYGPPEPLP